ncbi:8218_t:CDS:2 [Entrophospora sp. SA101]|nr:6307_t:CDS:2 [Entrophospora sp. SA101]CAJ0750207.1 8218_t:CDS:2 [Entrophospora sp. SA101]CAJ0840860.1 5392_t:CDS:2 [Entrophospora sp. SA101]CAJ0920567.1 9489_t:CDS:2 [Entrophospora sp. SA101]
MGIKQLFENPLPVDKITEKATAINLRSVARPYMRAFHFSWLGFLTAFTGWFAIPPLLVTITEDLKLSKDQEASSNIAAVSSTILFRIFTGPLTDRIGPKRVMGLLLIAGAIPIGLSGLVTGFEGLVVVRIFIGILGATFVPCQTWTTHMFNRNIVGSANALVGGWGNMGGGLTYILMPLVFGGLLDQGLSKHDAWRVAMVIPACLCFIVGISCLLFVDDCPQGEWRDHKPPAEETDVVTEKEVQTVIVTDDSKPEPTKAVIEEEKQIDNQVNKKVELAVDNVIGIFFASEFGLDQHSSSYIGSAFGLMNLFSRASGGFISDYANSKIGMRGRLLVQFLVLFLEGVFLIIFRYSLGSLTSAIVVLIIFSFFTQACCGTSFGIVPFVDPVIMGAVSGLVGAGGNVGGFFFNYVFKWYAYDKPTGFLVLGIAVLAVSFTTFALRIEQTMLLSRK